jgi:hypothetical protein
MRPVPRVGFWPEDAKALILRIDDCCVGIRFSTYTPSLSSSRMPRRIRPNPPFVDGLARFLVAAIAGNAKLVFRLIVNCRVYEEHAEGNKIARFELRG